MGAPLAERLELRRGSVAAVVGCGGKTALIERLATDAPGDRSVLVSTTTHIYPPPYARGNIACAGRSDARTGKLGAPEGLEELSRQYDLVLLEADGSRGLPLKGWRADEPVIPPYATHTVGVLPVSALGLAATEEHVLRVPEFLALTGLDRGAAVDERALSDMVGGMFANARGAQYLVVNQVEGDADIARARRILARIARDHPRRFAALVYGSARRGDFYGFEGECPWQNW